MSRVLTNEQNYYDIADTIRQMKNVNTTYKPREMASALKDIYSNEVEGLPPLSFEANGNNLLDYRIDGAIGGVGDLITDISDENYGKYKVPIVVSGKNLLPTPEVKSQTVNGVTISRFVNGIITIKGTPTAQMDVKFNFEESTFSAGSYIHLRNNFSTYNFAVSFRKDGVNKIAPGLGTLNSIKQITEDITVNQMVVLCNNNAVGTNYDITIQPSIELTNEETSYEPYHEPTTTNIYLDEPIEENESISLSDTEVDIPTIEGTNVLTIDTTIQPSNVYVQAPKDSEEIVYLTTILEEEI